MALAQIANVYKEQGVELLEAVAEIFKEADQQGFSIRIDLEALHRQLDEPFSIFVCGEFNSGKSSLLNALAGSSLAAVGILPTTEDVQVLLVPDLPTLRFIDSPGTNSIHEDHQEVTRTYLEHSDIVLFVTSVERPFSDSEAQFLDHIHSRWQRRILVAINKIDLIENQQDRNEIRSYVAAGFEKIIETSPPIFLVSARSGDGLQELESALRERLTESEQLRIKNKSIQETVRVHLRELSETLEHRVQHALLEKKVLNKGLSRVKNRFEEADVFFDLYKEKIRHVFHSGSVRFAVLLEEHYGILSALKTRLFGKQDQVKHKVRSLIDSLELDTQLTSIIEHAVSTFDDYQHRIVRDLQQDLELAEELAIEHLDLPELHYTPINEQELAKEFLAGTEQGLNRFFMYGSLAAATGIGISIAQTAALVDISGLLTVILLTTFGMRALPKEKKRIQEEVHKQFEDVAQSCHESLETCLREHLSSSQRELEQHFTPFLEKNDTLIEQSTALSERIKKHHQAIEDFVDTLQSQTPKTSH